LWWSLGNCSGGWSIDVSTVVADIGIVVVAIINAAAVIVVVVATSVVAVIVIIGFTAIATGDTIHIRLHRPYGGNLPADLILRGWPFNSNEVALTKYRLSVQLLKRHNAPRPTSPANNKDGCLLWLGPEWRLTARTTEDRSPTGVTGLIPRIERVLPICRGDDRLMLPRPFGRERHSYQDIEVRGRRLDPPGSKVAQA